MMLTTLILMAALQDEPKIERGEKAPDFKAPNQAGKEVRLADFKDRKNVLLAFYPKDNTPG